MADKPRILVVDDEPNILEVVELYLQREGFAVSVAADGEAALAAIERDPPDLIILDLMLPKVGGLEITRLLQDAFHIPIIRLTAKSEEDDKIIGLEMGADDYVTKPFSPRELVTRVKVVLRRAGDRLSPEAKPQPLQFNQLTVDPATRLVTVAGNSVTLTAKEFDLLWFFASHPGRVFTRNQLLDHVWGYNFFGDASTVTVHVRRLREKIEADPTHPEYVLTVWGVGYKFVAKD
ncbi:MAG: winged helix-turn-helix domain-containing protein [Anaerolineae bacterium]